MYFPPQTNKVMIQDEIKDQLHLSNNAARYIVYQYIRMDDNVVFVITKFVTFRAFCVTNVSFKVLPLIYNRWLLMKQDEVNRQDVFIQSNHITIDTVEVLGTYLLLNRLRFLITWHYVNDTRIYHCEPRIQWLKMKERSTALNNDTGRCGIYQ